jgi:hypothetical protein
MTLRCAAPSPLHLPARTAAKIPPLCAVTTARSAPRSAAYGFSRSYPLVRNASRTACRNCVPLSPSASAAARASATALSSVSAIASAARCAAGRYRSDSSASEPASARWIARVPAMSPARR